MRSKYACNSYYFKLLHVVSSCFRVKPLWLFDCFLVSFSEHATSSSLPSEDWGLNMEICDIVNETDEGCVCCQRRQISVYVVMTMDFFLKVFPKCIWTSKLYLKHLNVVLDQGFPKLWSGWHFKNLTTHAHIHGSVMSVNAHMTCR